jgi:thiol-disulfide isomerase/thioredoxin
MDSLARRSRLREIRADVAVEALLKVPLPEMFVGAAPEIRALVDDGKPTLLYWMSPSCPACRMNYDVLERLATQFEGRVLAVSPDGVLSIKEEYDEMAIPPVAVERAATASVFPEHTFPVTLVVRGRRRLAYTVGLLHHDSTAVILARGTRAESQ